MTAPGTPSTPGQGGAAVIIDGPGLYATADGREVEVTALHGECWRGHLGRNLGWWRYEASGELAGMPEHPDRIVRKLTKPTPAPSPAAEVDAGFTPGPWEVRDRDHPELVRAPDGGTVAHCGAEHDVWHGADPETAKANARLIAAAPDLYHALQGLYELVSARAIGIPDEQYIRVTAAAAALARATRTEGGAS